MWQEQDNELREALASIETQAQETRTAAKDSSLNALKGFAWGNTVALKDVSPIDHELNVTVSGKNLFDISKISPATSDNQYFKEVGEDYLIISSSESTTGNGLCSTRMLLRMLCPQLKAGNQYTISATTESTRKYLYLTGVEQYLTFGRTYTITEAMLGSRVEFYGFSISDGQSPGDCKISNIQIEYGTTVTEYEPYRKDVSSVTVTSLGKNLIPYPYKSGTVTMNGVTFTEKEDGSLILNGTSTGGMSYNFYIDIVNPLRFDGDYTFSWNFNKTCTGLNFYLSRPDDSTIWDVSVEGGNKTKNLENINVGKIRLYIRSGFTFDNVTIKPQLEYGTVATEYEPYQESMIIEPSVEGMNIVYSRYPSMTLIPNENDIVIACEYNRDLNKACDKLIQAIVSLGGNI